VWLALAPLAGHACSVVVGWLAARIAVPSVGGGFEDLGAAVLGFLLVQAALAVVCIGVTIFYLARNDRPRGLTVAASWLVGMFIVALVLGTLTG
jgi:hypothetical protein